MHPRPAPADAVRRAGPLLDVHGLEHPYAWAALSEVLLRGAAPTARTAGMPLALWPLANDPRADRARIQTLLDSGVCVADLATYARACREGGGYPEQTSGLMARDLAEMENWWAELPLREAVGWLLLAGGPTPAEDAADLAQQWYTPRKGVLAGGWRYAAAGLTRTEVIERRAAGVLDETSIDVMLALRGGAHLPAG